MWSPNGALVQVELGKDFINVITSPDNRTVFDKMRGQSPPQEGQLLINHTKYLRDYLWQNERLMLPIIEYRDNEELSGNQIVVYIGLERHNFQIERIEQLFDFLVYRVREYNKIPTDRATIKQILSTCIEDIKQDHYQAAFEKYLGVYYHSVLQNYEYERIRSLAETANIWTKNGDYAYAATLFSLALDLCNNPNLVDVHLRSQVGINAANVFKVLQQFNPSYQSYFTAGNIAFYSGNSIHVFLCLIGLAEINYIIGSFHGSLYYLDQAVKLVMTQGGDDLFQIAYHLQTSIIYIRDQLAIEATNPVQPQAQPLFEQIKQAIISALIQSIVGSVVYKLVGVSGAALSLISIFGSSEYQLNKPIFNEPTVIGDRGIIHVNR